MRERGKRPSLPFNHQLSKNVDCPPANAVLVAHWISRHKMSDFALICAIRKCATWNQAMIILTLASENGCWWAQPGHTLDTGSVQCVVLIRSLQGFSHFQSYYWILSQYTGRMKPVLRIEFNVCCLYLGTRNHCTVVEQIKGSKAERERLCSSIHPRFLERICSSCH